MSITLGGPPHVARRAAVLLSRPLESLNLITLHLGNGASAAAIRSGRSVDTSMGLTPLEGLVMGTRSGDLDPAVFAVLARVSGKFQLAWRGRRFQRHPAVFQAELG